MKRFTPSTEYLGDDNLFVPDTPSATAAFINGRTTNPSPFDGATIEQMSNNPIYQHGMDDIDAAAMCKSSLFNSRETLELATKQLKDAQTKKSEQSAQRDRFKNL